MIVTKKKILRNKAERRKSRAGVPLFERSVQKLVNELNGYVDKQLRSGKMDCVPNQRKAGKKFIGGYASRNLARHFKATARKETGGNIKKLLMKMISEGLRRRGVYIKDDTDKK